MRPHRRFSSGRHERFPGWRGEEQDEHGLLAKPRCPEMTGHPAMDGTMREGERRLYELIEPTVNALGFELVGVQLRGGRSRGLARVYIDRDEGVTVDDCARVSHRINGLLDVEDPMPGEYDLEVSSPGADRPLFVERDFVRFRGADVQLTLRIPLAGRRRFTGTLGGFRDGVLLVDEHGTEHCFALSQIESAWLTPQW